MVGYQETVSEMVAFSGNIRGIVIEGCIMVERGIDFYISSYFADHYNKQKELSHLFSRHLNLEVKRAIYMEIIKTEAKNESKQYNSDLKKIEKILQERNVLAHMELDISHEAIDKFKSTRVIQFIKHRNGISKHEITDEMLSDFQANVPKVINAMDKIFKASIHGWKEERNKPI